MRKTHGRAYVMKTTPHIPDAERDAARRLVARHVTDSAERAEVEDMLGIAS